MRLRNLARLTGLLLPIGCHSASLPPVAEPAADSDGPSQSTQLPSVSGELPAETLVCESSHWYFTGPGSYALTLAEFSAGGRNSATLCVEGSSHSCNGTELIVSGEHRWSIDDRRVVNVDEGTNHLQIWQQESGGASGGSNAPCTNGQRSSAAIFESTNGFRVVLTVSRL